MVVLAEGIQNAHLEDSLVLHLCLVDIGLKKEWKAEVSSHRGLKHAIRRSGRYGPSMEITYDVCKYNRNFSKRFVRDGSP